MDKTLQKKFRQETKEYFLKVGYQQLLQASFNAREFEDMAALTVKNGETVKHNEEEIRAIKARLDHHSVENRTKIKELEEVNVGLKQTGHQFQPIMNQLNEEIKLFRQKGMRHLKMAEYCDGFEMADKK